MVCTILNQRDNVIDVQKLKFNHEPETIGFTAKVWILYGAIFMVLKRVGYEKSVIELFFFFFLQ